jgi:type II secretory pathway pseudopilin PulG
MMHTTRLRRRNGFTIIEAVVTMSILAAVGVTVMALIVSSIKGWSSGTSGVNADSALDQALHKFYQDIRVGCSAYVSNGELYVTVPARVTDAYGESYYDRSVGTTVYKYYVQDKILYRKIGDNAAKVFARDITEDIQFEVVGDTVAITSVTGNSQVGMSTSEEVGCAKIVMRNFGS